MISRYRALNKEYNDYSERRKKWESVEEMVEEYRQAFDEYSLKPYLCEATDFEGGFDKQVAICRKLIKKHFKDKRIHTYMATTETITSGFRDLSDSNLHEFSCIAAFALEGFKYTQSFQNCRLKLRFNITRKEHSAYISSLCKKGNDEARRNGEIE